MQLKILVTPASGGDYRQFHAPANIAMARSPVIRQKCDQGSTTIIIDREKPHLMGAYLHLICTIQVILAPSEETMNHWDTCKGTVGLYLLAQKLGDAVSTDLTIDHFVKVLDSESLITRLVQYTYAHAQFGSALCRVLVDYVAGTMASSRFRPKLIHKWPPEFFYDLAVEMTKRRDVSGLRVERLSGGDTGKYHA